MTAATTESTQQTPAAESTAALPEERTTAEGGETARPVADFSSLVFDSENDPGALTVRYLYTDKTMRTGENYVYPGDSCTIADALSLGEQVPVSRFGPEAGPNLETIWRSHLL